MRREGRVRDCGALGTKTVGVEAGGGKEGKEKIYMRKLTPTHDTVHVHFMTPTNHREIRRQVGTSSQLSHGEASSPTRGQAGRVLEVN